MSPFDKGNLARTDPGEALSVIAATVDESHDGLATFTQKLQAIGDIPSFWWGEFPVRAASNSLPALNVWPILSQTDGMLRISDAKGDTSFDVPFDALKAFADTTLETPLSDAEFTVFIDLASGLRIEQSAERAGLAISTRRKQLQTAFRKLAVWNQSELVSLASTLVQRFAAQLSDQYDGRDHGWGDYTRHLPTGVRCGLLERAGQPSVKFLDIGPADGRPVLVLHPMIFPHIEDEDVALCHELGWRMIWPVRNGCLSMNGNGTQRWSAHCAQTVKDIRAAHQMCAGGAVPIIALVSSGAYATAFANAHPECVARIDFVSTCFSAGKSKSRDVYFGDFLLRGLRNNRRMALVAIQHLTGAVFDRDRLETTLRRVFKGSPADQDLIGQDFASANRTDRLKFAIRQSIASMRLDYTAQLHFSWSQAQSLGVPKQFWHGAEDRVHNLEDLHSLSDFVSGAPASVIPEMGHITQGAPLRATLRRIAAAHSKQALLQTK